MSKARVRERERERPGNASKQKENHNGGEHPPYRPWMSVVLTVCLAVSIGYCWDNWAKLYPVIEVLVRVQSINQSGGTPSQADLAALQSFQSLDMNLVVVELIWFIAMLAASVILLILAIVGWVRGW